MKKTILITGSSGLIGSESVRFFDQLGWDVHGVDNNQRKEFFGSDGDTSGVAAALKTETGYTHHEFDIRDQERIESLFKRVRPDAIIHAAAQPSHDWAKTNVITDFEVNSLATLYLLEAAHRHVSDSPFIFMSTNKVYGDAPNELSLIETGTRWEYANESDWNGIDESCRIDASTHSFFGVSKASADLMVQEFGRCHGMKTVCFRAGCLTGPSHAAAELHGFLAYLARAAKENRPYTIFGYKGKQVRDNLHTKDVCRAFWCFLQNPKSAEVYNLGGGRDNSVSMLEAITKVEQRTGRPMNVKPSPEARLGDHICYISDIRKFQSHYPSWSPEISIDDILDELCDLSATSIL